MALRIIRKGNGSISNDHNKLYNRGLQNQHPIESITNLKKELDMKYEKPESGIPPTDLGFNVVTVEDLNNATSILEQKILVIKTDVSVVSDRVTVLEELLGQLTDGDGSVEGATINFAYRRGFREDYLTVQDDKVFILENTFIADTKHLRVYRDGELLTPLVDYVESNDYTITFKYELEAETFITFICDSMSQVLSPIHEEIISLKDQTEFKLKNRYSVGEHTLSIFVGGFRLELERDYFETDRETINIPRAYPPGTKLIFRQEIVSTAGKVIYHGEEYNQASWSFEFIAEEGQTDFSINEAFIPGSNMLHVMAEGLLQWSGETFDYLEINENTIRFNYPLEKGDRIRITCVSATMEWSKKVIAEENQTVIILDKPYLKGKYDIQVFEDGVLLQPMEDYEETNLNTITFVEPLEKGSHITVTKRR